LSAHRQTKARALPNNLLISISFCQVLVCCKRQRVAPAVSRTKLGSCGSADSGTIRAELETKGEIIGNNDLWIAAHALASGLTLVTNNEKEYQRVRGLKIQNWTV
jgi:hypothetical protein